MAFSLNKIMLIGNLGQDAETRFTTNNTAVTSFSMATTHGYKGKDGNWINETTWHKVTAFALSDFFRDALKKGKKFYVEGRIQKREFTDKEGIKRYSTEVIAETLIPLDSTGGSDGYSQSGGGNFSPESSSPPDSSSEDNDLPF